VVAATLVAAAISFELLFFAAGHILFVISHLIFIAVVAPRFLQRKTPPPPTFALVGTGVLAGLLGGVINAGIALEALRPEWDLAGRRMLTEGMVLLLVLGVGGFLGPRLLGFAQLPDLQAIGQVARQTRPSFMVRYGATIYAAAGVVLLVSVVLEYAMGIAALAWLRATLATVLVAASIRPWSFPATRSTLAWCVWFAHWFLIAGVWIVAAVPRYRIDFLHILFMGAFTLLILAVGTRVVLSHGGHSLAEEKKSWPLRLGLFTGLVAMLARLAAPFLPLSYFSHLAWAGILWMAGVLFWGIYLMRRIRA
jgi:hypothetical protein